MDIRSATHAGSYTQHYATLTRGRAAEPAAHKNPTDITATQRAAVDILRTRLAESGITLPVAAKADEFTPERVAERILDFVGLALKRAAPGDEDRVLAAARKGVEQGFREAREILQALDVLNGDIAENVDETYDRVISGLDKLAGNAPVEQIQSQQAVSATQSGSAQSGSVRIETREGDVVTVNFSKISAQAQISAASQSEHGRVYGTASAAYQSEQLSYSVEGDLNEAEQAAIDHLLQRVDKIADRFFAGNVQAAFKQASHMQVNAEQISILAVTLERRSVQQALMEYQSTQSDTVVPTSAQVLADYANQVRDLMASPSVDGLANPTAVAGQLLDANVTLRGVDLFGDNLQQGALGLLRELLAYLINEPALTETSKPTSENDTGALAKLEANNDGAAEVDDATADEPLSAPESALLVA